MMKQKILFPFVGDSVGGSHRSAITLMTELQSREIDILAVIHNQYEPLEKLFLHLKDIAKKENGSISQVTASVNESDGV